MSAQPTASAQADIVIDADPDTVYRLITDLPTLAQLAEETDAMSWRKVPADARSGTGIAPRPGAVFTGANRNGSRTWSTTCTVTEAEPGRVFAIDVRSAVIPVAHWRYDIVAEGSGCRVTERTWDRRPGWFRIPAGWATGVRDRASANAKHIELTLQRLKDKAEQTS